MVQAAWVIRADARPAVGAGHLSRCLNLARALRTYRPAILVIEPGALGWTDRIREAGVKTIAPGLPVAPPMQGIILDGYGFEESDAAAIANLTDVPLAVIDDFDAPMDCADLIINTGPQKSGDRFKGRPALNGPQYALLDPRFSEDPRPIETHVRHIAVSFGSADRHNIAGQIISVVVDVIEKAKRPIGDAPIDLSVVVGATAPNRHHIEAQIETMPDAINARVLVNVEDMAAFYRSADLAIGAGGVGMLERMASGLPSITLTIADNQEPGTDAAARTGATAYAGRSDKFDRRRLVALMTGLLSDQNARARMAKKGRQLVDGQGARRSADALELFSDSWHKQRQN